MSAQRLAPSTRPLRWSAASAVSVTAVSVVVVEAALLWRFGLGVPLAPYGCLGAAITLAAVIDARTSTMPNILLLPSYPIGIGLFALASAEGGTWWSLGRAVISMAAVAGFYLVLALAAGGQRMGLADVTLGGLLGLLLGFVGWSALTTGVVLGWAFALAAVLVLRRGPSVGRAAIAAGPCLWLGALVAVLLAR